MTVEILWYTNNRITDRLIQFGQLVNLTILRLLRQQSNPWSNARFTHIAIKIGDNLYEALNSGVRVLRGVDAERRRAQAVASSNVQTYPHQLSAAINFLEDQVNDPYGFVEIIFVALDQLFPFLPISLSASADGTYICSALVAFALLILGVRVIDHRNPYLQTPASLANVFNPSPLC